MGRKVHPKIFRMGVIYTWGSKWFAGGRDYAKLLREDIKIKEYLRKQLKDSSVDRIDIERTARAMTVTVYSAKPGAIIGRGGTGIEDLKKKLSSILAKRGESKIHVNLNVIYLPFLFSELSCFTSSRYFSPFIF